MSLAREFVARRWFPLAALIALYVAAVLVYSLVALQHVLEDVHPDEILYGKLSQSLSLGNGLRWRGSGYGLPPLWPALLSLVWHFGTPVDGYNLARVLGSLLACATVFPVWLLGRELVGPRLALIPALLSVAGAWMETTAFIVSENLAYPLATASLACTVMAIRDTRPRWIGWSLLFALVAAMARTQMLVLPVILVVALALDVIRQPRGRRGERMAARPRILWAVIVLGVIGLLAAFVIAPGLTNYKVLAHHVTVAKLLNATGRHVLSSFNQFAFVPVAVAAALAARPANWRDEAAGPVLVTLTAAVAVLFPLLGRFEAFATHWPVERYTMYLAPLLFLTLVLAPRRIGRWTTVVAAGIVAALMLLVPHALSRVEEPALIAVEKHVRDLGLGDHSQLGFVALALIVGVAGALALTARHRAGGLALAVALVAATLGVQAWTSQSLEIAQVKDGRKYLAPPRLDWVDPHVDGPVGTLDFGKPQPTHGNYDLFTIFFNKRIDRMYATVPGIGHCRISFAPDGTLVDGGGAACGEWPRYLVVLRSTIVPTLAGQRVLATTPLHGTLVRIPPGPPRALGLVEPPCQLTVCVGGLRFAAFLRAPGRVALTFGAAPTAHWVQIDGKRYALPAGRATTLRLDAPAGTHQFAGPVSWTRAAGAPKLESVVVSGAGATTRLY